MNTIDFVFITIREVLDNLAKNNNLNLKKMDQKFGGEIYMRRLIAPGSIDYGKVYIGQTICIEDRNSNWYKPDNNYGGMKITEARNKYGVSDDVWETKTLEKIFADTEEDLHKQLNERETYYIGFYDSVENGFNGSYGRGMQGLNHSDAAKAKISAHHRKTQTNATKAKISASTKGHSVSDVTKAKISAGNKGKSRTEAVKAALSAKRKGKEPKAASEGLQQYIAKNGHGPTLGIKQSDEAKTNMKKAQQKLGVKVLAISPDGSQKEFNTMLDAAKEFGLNVGSVASVIKTGGTCRNGMKFQKI